MAGRVAGKVAFITGAARGQGRSHAIRHNAGPDPRPLAARRPRPIRAYPDVAPALSAIFAT